MSLSLDRKVMLDEANEKVEEIQRDKHIRQIDEMTTKFPFTIQFLEEFQDPRLCQILARVLTLSLDERDRLVKIIDEKFVSAAPPMSRSVARP